jgi:hypothetical protein
MLQLVLHTMTTVLGELNTRPSRRRAEKRWLISRYLQLRYQVEMNNSSVALSRSGRFFSIFFFLAM